MNPTDTPAADTPVREAQPAASYDATAKQKTAYEIASCLVGSEMCIRDRPRLHAPPAPPP